MKVMLDRCCRQHDLGCPDTIAGGERVGGLVNTRGQTLSHCSCDSRQKYKFMMSHELRCRFRACLTVARTRPARLRPWLGCRAVTRQPRSYRPSSHTNNTRARDIIWGYLAF